MKRSRLVQALGAFAALALLAGACSSNSGSGSTSTTTGSSAQAGVKGGTLRINDLGDVDSLDTATAYGTVSWGLIRLYGRQLYSWNSSNPATITTPVPDLATSYTVNSNKTVWTFTIRPNVMYAPPVNRDVQAKDFITAVERMYDKTTPSGGQSYSNLIKGAAEFGAGKAKTISGMKALSATQIQFTLVQPTADFLSIVALPFFTPVPGEYASKYKVGNNYSEHIVGPGPYVISNYTPTKSITFIRNKNWDPSTDPLRHAWVNKIDLTEGYTQQTIQQQLETGNADVTLDATPPNSDLQQLSTNPTLSKQFADPITSCVWYLELGSSPASGPIGGAHGLLIRQAVNYALDKVGIIRANGGPLAGSPASTILSPLLGGYHSYDLYPTPGSHGNIAKAKALLKTAGYPNGITLSYVGSSEGNGPATTTAVQTSLARAGIHLTIQSYPGFSNYTDNLSVTSKAMQHQTGFAGWCADYPIGGARSFVVPLLYGPSIIPTGNNNYMQFNNSHENALIAQAIKAPSLAAQNSLWYQSDHYAMSQAVWAPVYYARQPAFWATRVHNWVFSPWTTTPDLANIYLNPNTP